MTVAAAAPMSLQAATVRRGRQDVLHSVDLDIRPGELLAIVGPNGAGKSTVLAALSGDLPLVNGHVLLNGRPLTDWRPADLARHRAVLLQHNVVAFGFTATEIVRMGRAPWDDSTPVEDEAVVLQAMRDTDTMHLAQRPVTSLSGGEQARVALARTLAQQTPVLLLDEPTAALDLRHAETILVLLAAHAEAGRSVVAVLHDLDLAAAHAHRVALIANGTLLADGPPEEVLTSELLSHTYGHPVEVIAHPRTGQPLVLPCR